MVKHNLKKVLFSNSLKELRDIKIRTFEAGKAKIARLFIAGNFSRRFEDARKVLKKISDLDFKADYFLTPSGFLVIPWKFSRFEEAAEEGRLWAEKLLKGVEINANHVLIGMDSYSSNNFKKPHVELSIICSHDNLHCTSKIYSTVNQQIGLIKAEINSHFVELDDRVMVLCCHDLSMFNPRSDSVVKEWRKEIREKFREKTMEFNPEVALHHSHYTDTPLTWLVSWRNLEREVPSVKHYATSGVYYNEKGVRAEIGKTLELTKKGSVSDVLVDASI